MRAAIGERYGSRAEVSESFGETTVDVAPGDWIDLLTFARDDLGCVFFDWLTGVDDPPGGFLVVAHVYDPVEHAHLLARTQVPREDPRLPSATQVYRGADWHERETFEMFGVIFEGHPHLVPLLLPDGFEGHPLRKEFILASRVAKPWPGAKEPGESGQGSPSRRKTLPPGVPTDWGPQATTPPPTRGPRAPRPSEPRAQPARADEPPSAASTAPPVEASERPSPGGARPPEGAEPPGGAAGAASGGAAPAPKAPQAEEGDDG